MVTHLYNLLIKDAEDTIRHVCKAVLENPDTDVDQRKQMAEGILHIARAFQVPTTQDKVLFFAAYLTSRLHIINVHEMLELAWQCIAARSQEALRL